MISGGTISYENGVKAATDYTPAAKARVELTFAVAEGSDPNAVTDSVIAMCQAKVAEMLGQQVAAAAKPATTKKPAEVGQTVAEKQEANVKAMASASKVTAKVISDKEKLAQAAGLATETAKTPSAKPDPASMEDVAVTGDESLDDIMGGGAEPVTDKDLADAVQAKNREIKDPVKIRGVIFEFNGGPGHEIKDIPQAQRAAFLEKLKALSK